MFDSYRNKFSLSKTLCFNLIPTEITKVNLDNNEELLLNDLELENNKNIVYEEFDKILLNNVCSISDEEFSEELHTIKEEFIVDNSSKEDKKYYEKIKNDIQNKIIKKIFSVNEELFGTETIKILSESSENHKEFISKCKKGRFDKFISSRENAINDMGKRIVSNAELMVENCHKLEKVISDNYSIENEIVDYLDNFNIGLHKQNNIDEYNEKIAYLNKKMNEDLQSGILNKKYKFNKLNKFILSSAESLFEFVQYKNVGDVKQGFEKLFHVYNVVDMYKKLYSLFAEYEESELDKIIVSNSKIHNFSNLVYNNHQTIPNKLKEYAEQNIKSQKARDNFVKKDISIADLNNILGENVFNKIEIDMNSYKKSYFDFVSCSIEDKNYLDFCLQFCNNIIDTFSTITKLFATSEENKFSSEYKELCEFYISFNKIFNCTKNFATKKNEFIKYYNVTWGNNDLLKGWSETKIRDYRSLIFIKDNKYYFGYLNTNKYEFESTSDENNSYKRMIYMQMSSCLKQFPRMIFTKEVKEHFENSSESFIKEDGMVITKEIYDIYKNATYKENKQDNIKYIEFNKNFVINYYPQNKYYNFSGLKKAEEYSSYQDFIKDVEEKMFCINYENVSDECIEKLQKENKLWLFQIFCKDFSDRRKKDSSKNIHTLIFESFFSEENKNNNYPIRMSGGAEIRYREKGVTDGTVHKKGSIMLNKKDKNGNKIPGNIYVNLYKFLNNEKITLNDEEKEYIDKKLLIYFATYYDIVKDRRYNSSKYEIHIPFKLNSNAENKSSYELNKQIDDEVKEKRPNIIGIDRGERNLLCATVINGKSGEVIERICLDKINGVDYNNILSTIEKERQNARKSWNSIPRIKEAKKGFLSLAVKTVVDLVEKYDAIICLENLNSGFVNSRKKIEKSIYQQFTNQLINKLSYCVVNKKESVINPKQLAFVDNNNNEHNGIIYFVYPAYTSKIDNTTGFSNQFDFSKITNSEKRKKFFEKMNIKFEDNVYKFDFYYKDFDTYNNSLDDWNFIVTSFGDRIKRIKNESGFWKSKKINLTDELNNLFNDKSNIQKTILNDDKICNKVFEIFKLIVQMRNTDENNDYLISPVQKNGEHYDTRNINYNSIYCNCNPDMEASYNIAIKGMLKVYQNKKELKDFFDFLHSK